MTGAKRLRARLLGLGRACDLAAKAAALEAAEAARDDARALVPVDTGRLRDSIRAGAASVETECPYAAAVELGTAAMPARPYLLPAALGARFAERAAARAKGGLR